MQSKTFHAVSLPTVARAAETPRAVIEFTGIDLAGPSYEGRVFLNNPEAGPETPMTVEHGYVGSFHVYGYSPEPKTTRVPIRRYIVASEAVQRAAAIGSTATVTLVPVLSDEEGQTEGVSVDGVAIATDPA